MAGIGVGFAAIQVLNLVRIISLFYLGQWNRVWFDWFHLYLWQALIVLDALVAFLVWLRYLPRDRAGLSSDARKWEPATGNR
jgi:exosortase/archaeosortase family protein